MASDDNPPDISSGMSRSMAQNVRRPTRKTGQPETEVCMLYVHTVHTYVYYMYVCT
jgi:hypothetical protein